MPLQIRRGTDAERLAMIQPLAAGELVYITDSQRLYIGNGSAIGGVQITGYTNEDAVDAVGAALVAGSHNGINFTYGLTQDNANRIDATVSISQLAQNLNLNNYNITGTGNINIAGNVTITGRFTGDYKGSIFGDDSTSLVNAIDSSINLDGTVKGNVVPDSDTARNLGNITKRFNTLYLSNGITLGSRSISVLNGNVDLPTGTTIGGEPLGAATLRGTDLNVNIIADDSTKIVNSSNGSFHGLLYGSVAADDSSLIINHYDRTFSGGLGANLTLNSYNITGNGNIAISGSGSFTSTLNSNTSVTAPIITATSTLNADNVHTSDTNPSGFEIYALVGQSLDLNTYKGTSASPTSTVAGEVVGNIAIKGLNSTGDYVVAGALSAQWHASATLSDEFPKSTLRIYAGGGGGAVKELSFNYAGVVKAPVFQLTSYANDAARSDAIPSPEAGMMVFMISGTNPAVNSKAVIFNGTTWAVLPG
jgi:hypothetical protein